MRGRFDRELLERFRPQLVYDRQYDCRVTAVETIVDNPGNLLRRFDEEVIARADGSPPLSLATLSNYPQGYEPRGDDCLCEAPSHIVDARRMEGEYAQCVYGRVIEHDGRRWLQYWLWLYYNPKNILGLGKHEGDWEFVQIGLGRDHATPELVTYSQHDFGEGRSAATGVEFIADAGEWHPVVYVAPLSHACYFEPRTHVYRFGIDHPYGDGASILPHVRPFGDWVQWAGRWGNTAWAVGRKLGRGPESPACQGIRWERPGLFHRRTSRRWSRLRVLAGAFVHALGTYTYPPPPQIESRRTAVGIEVTYRLGGGGARRARHLYLTILDGDRVIRSRIVEDAASDGEEIFPMPSVPECVVWASAFNRLRQRSDVVRSIPSSR